MKITPRRFLGIIASLSALITATATASRAQITFSIDAFSSDELTITLNPSTLTGSPSDPKGYFTIIGMVGDNFGSSILASNSWITAGDDLVGSQTTPGTIGSVNFDAGGLTAQASTFAGPSIFIRGEDSLDTGKFVTGTSITSPYQITFSAPGRFDTSVITGLRLYWGDIEEFGYSSSGALQSTTSLSVVPEPGTFAAILGFFALACAVIRRRRLPI